MNKEIIQEFRDSLGSESKSKLFNEKYPDFCARSIDYLDRMTEFAEHAATKQDVAQAVKDGIAPIYAEQQKHNRRITDMESKTRENSSAIAHLMFLANQNAANQTQSAATMANIHQAQNNSIAAANKLSEKLDSLAARIPESGYMKAKDQTMMGVKLSNIMIIIVACVSLSMFLWVAYIAGVLPEVMAIIRGGK